MKLKTIKNNLLKLSKLRRSLYTTAILVTLLSTSCLKNSSDKKELIYEDDFSSDLSNWIIETGESEDAKVTIEDEKMIIDVDRGATVWLDKKLSGNIQIEYDRKVVMEGGKNDRLSDLNQFWMANDPKRNSLFTRHGIFKEYDSLQLYYFGVGGNRNTTTRFRKYNANGDRVLIHDLREEKHMLQPNKTYHVKTIFRDGVTKVYIDGEELILFEDDEPYTNGYFGIRTTESRHEIDNLKIYRIE